MKYRVKPIEWRLIGRGIASLRKHHLDREMILRSRGMIGAVAFQRKFSTRAPSSIPSPPTPSARLRRIPDLDSVAESQLNPRRDYKQFVDALVGRDNDGPSAAETSAANGQQNDDPAPSLPTFAVKSADAGATENWILADAANRIRIDVAESQIDSRRAKDPIEFLDEIPAENLVPKRSSASSASFRIVTGMARQRRPRILSWATIESAEAEVTQEVKVETVAGRSSLEATSRSNSLPSQVLVLESEIPSELTPTEDIVAPDIPKSEPSTATSKFEDLFPAPRKSRRFADWASLEASSEITQETIAETTEPASVTNNSIETETSSVLPGANVKRNSRLMCLKDLETSSEVLSSSKLEAALVSIQTDANDCENTAKNASLIDEAFDGRKSKISRMTLKDLEASSEAKWSKTASKPSSRMSLRELEIWSMTQQSIASSIETAAESSVADEAAVAAEESNAAVDRENDLRAETSMTAVDEGLWPARVKPRANRTKGWNEIEAEAEGEELEGREIAGVQVKKKILVLAKTETTEPESFVTPMGLADNKPDVDRERVDGASKPEFANEAPPAVGIESRSRDESETHDSLRQGGLPMWRTDVLRSLPRISIPFRRFPQADSPVTSASDISAAAAVDAAATIPAAATVDAASAPIEKTEKMTAKTSAKISLPLEPIVRKNNYWLIMLNILIKTFGLKPEMLPKSLRHPPEDQTLASEENRSKQNEKAGNSSANAEKESATTTTTTTTTKSSNQILPPPVRFEERRSVENKRENYYKTFVDNVKEEMKK